MYNFTYADEANVRISRFFDTMVAGESPEKAMDQLMRGSLVARQKADQILLLKKQTKLAFEFYGKPENYELLDSKAYGKSLVRYRYLTKTLEFPVFWEFWMYRHENDWEVLSVLFNDQVKTIVSQ